MRSGFLRVSAATAGVPRGHECGYAKVENSCVNLFIYSFVWYIYISKEKGETEMQNDNAHVSRWERFEQNHQEALDTIKMAIEGEVADYDKEYQHLARWLFATQHNPYGIFGMKQWHAGATEYAEGFASILHDIHHSLVDDGDICFPVVDGQPYIYLTCRDDERMLAELLQENEGYVKVMKEHGIYEPPKLTFLKDAYQFTEAYEAHEEAERAKIEKFNARMKAMGAKGEHDL
jgi:hypothetical protein